jgi:class 3 adenylate cyclase/Tfp pilus assembly protein PilF
MSLFIIFENTDMDIQALHDRIASATEITADIVDAMNNLSAAQFDIDLTAAYDWALCALSHARRLSYATGEAQALTLAGNTASRQHNYNEALGYYREALRIRMHLDDKHAAGHIQAKMGNTELRSGNYDSALNHYNKALDLLSGYNDELIIADINANSGLIYSVQGNYTRALKSHLQSLAIYERLHETMRIASACSNIGLIYTEQQNYTEALKMSERALNIYEKSNNLGLVSDILVNIGIVYQEQEQYDKALEAHKRALSLYENMGDNARIATTYSNIGNVYKKQGNNESALDFYNRSLFLFEKVNDKRGLVQSYNNLGELYYELGNNKEAHRYLKSAVELAEDSGLKNQLRKAYEYISVLYARAQSYEEAYKYHILYTKLDKEISNAEIAGQMAQIALRHEIEQKERDAEMERIKNIELQKAYDLIENEKKRSEELLLNILPEEVSQELKEFGKTKARSFDIVTVLFADIKGFTKISEQLSAEEIVSGIDQYFEVFDLIVEKHGIEKIKTIGDAYLCVSGMPIADPLHAERMITVAREFIKAVTAIKEERTAQGKQSFDFRIGIHSGPVVAGVVGIKKFAYDIWGDTVNTASRMQSNSEPNRINISESTYRLIQHKIDCLYRGEIEAKNKGKLKMYFVD